MGLFECIGIVIGLFIATGVCIVVGGIIGLIWGKILIAFLDAVFGKGEKGHG